MKNKILKEIWSKEIFQKVDKKLEEKDTGRKWQAFLLYGEITKEGTDDLFKYLRENKLVPEYWSIVDVGSGFGKMVFHSALEDDITKSDGIEIMESKNNIAKETLNELKDMFEEFPHEKITLMHGSSDDFTNLDYSVIFHNSIAWKDETVRGLNSISMNSIHVSTKSTYSINDPRIDKICTLHVKFSWSKPDKLTPIYLYKLSNK